jgi:hypothetical protein
METRIHESNYHSYHNMRVKDGIEEEHDIS